MRTIILAAGQGTVLDGMVKCLIKHPGTGKTLLEHMLEAFSTHAITVVVGYRAIEIMQHQPHLHYVYNREWALTNSAYSLGLALTEEPCFVVSGDLFFCPSLIRQLEEMPGNVAVTTLRENRPLSAINCVMRNGRIEEAYMGHLRNAAHEEALGLFKIVDPDLLRTWKDRCLKYGNMFAGMALPFEEFFSPVTTLPLGREPFFEVNTVDDYLRLLEVGRGICPY
ncbi:MAG: NTP transferase domain-containing protein [Desulfovibrionaceae bacterium]|nr:NTP transferase domain-containing protein [Desulfovibrionaceae bacterium]